MKDEKYFCFADFMIPHPIVASATPFIIHRS
jgi:hypothetical protein